MKMQVAEKTNWEFKWTNIGAPGDNQGMALFSAPHIGTNFIYTFDGINKILEKGAVTAIPKAVLVEALQSFLYQQANPERIYA